MHELHAALQRDRQTSQMYISCSTRMTTDFARVYCWWAPRKRHSKYRGPQCITSCDDLSLRGGVQWIVSRALPSAKFPPNRLRFMLVSTRTRVLVAILLYASALYLLL